MSEIQKLRDMISYFRVSELQQLLVFSGKSKGGKKSDLLERSLRLIYESPTSPIKKKIKELHNKVVETSSYLALVKNKYYNQPSNNNINISTTAIPFMNMNSRENSNFHMSQRNPQVHNFLPTNVSLTNGTINSQQNLSPMTNFEVQPNIKYKALPFYDKISNLIKPTKLLPSNFDKCVIQETFFIFRLSPQMVQDIVASKFKSYQKDEFGIQLQLRFCNYDSNVKEKDGYEDYFPSNLMVKVNSVNTPLPALLPPKPPSTEAKRPGRPLNITPLVILSPMVDNQIDICWSNSYEGNNIKEHVTGLFFVKKFTTEFLLEKIREKSFIRPTTTKSMIKETLKIHQGEEESDISTTGYQISLLCPLSKCKMKNACRSIVCDHFQCFDAFFYLAMNEKNAKWICPICSGPALYETLAMDSLLNDILKSCPQEYVTIVEFFRDATWKPVLENSYPNKEYVAGRSGGNVSDASSSRTLLRPKGLKNIGMSLHLDQHQNGGKDDSRNVATSTAVADSTSSISGLDQHQPKSLYRESTTGKECIAILSSSEEEDSTFNMGGTQLPPNTTTTITTDSLLQQPSYPSCRVEDTRITTATTLTEVVSPLTSIHATSSSINVTTTLIPTVATFSMATTPFTVAERPPEEDQLNSSSDLVLLDINSNHRDSSNGSAANSPDQPLNNTTNYRTTPTSNSSLLVPAPNEEEEETISYYSKSPSSASQQPTKNLKDLQDGTGVIDPSLLPKPVSPDFVNRIRRKRKPHTSFTAGTFHKKTHQSIIYSSGSDDDVDVPPITRSRSQLNNVLKIHERKITPPPASTSSNKDIPKKDDRSKPNKNQKASHSEEMDKLIEIIDLCSSPETVTNDQHKGDQSSNTSQREGPTQQHNNVSKNLSQTFSSIQPGQAQDAASKNDLSAFSMSTQNLDTRPLTPMEIDTIGYPTFASLITEPSAPVITSSTDNDYIQMLLKKSQSVAFHFTSEPSYHHSLSTIAQQSSLSSTINPTQLRTLLSVPPTTTASNNERREIELADLEIAKNICSLMRRDSSIEYININDQSPPRISFSNSQAQTAVNSLVKSNTSVTNGLLNCNVRKIDAKCTQLLLAKTSQFGLQVSGVTTTISTTTSHLVNKMNCSEALGKLEEYNLFHNFNKSSCNTTVQQHQLSKAALNSKACPTSSFGMVFPSYIHDLLTTTTDVGGTYNDSSNLFSKLSTNTRSNLGAGSSNNIYNNTMVSFKDNNHLAATAKAQKSYPPPTNNDYGFYRPSLSSVSSQLKSAVNRPPYNNNNMSLIQPPPPPPPHQSRLLPSNTLLSSFAHRLQPPRYYSVPVPKDSSYSALSSLGTTTHIRSNNHPFYHNNYSNALTGAAGYLTTNFNPNASATSTTQTHFTSLGHTNRTFPTTPRKSMPNEDAAFQFRIEPTSTHRPFPLQPASASASVRLSQPNFLSTPRFLAPNFQDTNDNRLLHDGYGRPVSHFHPFSDDYRQGFLNNALVDNDDSSPPPLKHWPSCFKRPSPSSSHHFPH